MGTVETHGTDGKIGKNEKTGQALRRSENFIENYGFTNMLDISVGTMLLGLK